MMSAPGVLARYDGSQTTYALLDGLGSVRQLTDSSGVVQMAQTFDPYGNIYSKAGSASTEWGFTGQQTDSNGFVFLRARYYNPSQGQFFQLDSVMGDSQRPLSLNPYIYSLDNPVLYTDPTGHDPWWCDNKPDQSQCLDEEAWKHDSQYANDGAEYARLIKGQFDVTLGIATQEGRGGHGLRHFNAFEARVIYDTLTDVTRTYFHNSTARFRANVQLKFIQRQRAGITPEYDGQDDIVYISEDSFVVPSTIYERIYGQPPGSLFQSDTQAAQWLIAHEIGHAAAGGPYVSSSDIFWAYSNADTCNLRGDCDIYEPLLERIPSQQFLDYVDFLHSNICIFGMPNKGTILWRRSGIKMKPNLDESFADLFAFNIYAPQILEPWETRLIKAIYP